jgi:hypothetical protein
LPPNAFLLTGGYNYQGTPLGMDWQSASLRTVSATIPRGIDNRILFV